jgi:hypothetical protein
MLKRDNPSNALPAATAPASPKERAAAADAWRHRNAVLLCACGGAWLLVSLLLTRLLPDSWEDDSGVFSSLVTGMMTIVPSIGKYAAVSSFKGVTEAYLAITWALVFVTSLSLMRRSWPLDGRRRIPATGRWIVFWLLVLFFIAVCVGQFIGLRVTAASLSGYSLSAFVLRAISSSRSALALYGTALYALQSILITSVVVVARNFRRLWLTSQSVYPNN